MPIEVSRHCERMRAASRLLIAAACVLGVAGAFGSESYLRSDTLKRERGDAAAAERQGEIETLQTDRDLKRERFDLEIRERKALTEKIASLQEKIRQDSQRLRTFEGEVAQSENPGPLAREALPAADGDAAAKVPGEPKSALPTVPGLPDLQSIQKAVEAEKSKREPSKRQAADAAQGRVERLQNPFSLQNLINWLSDHGPKLIAILVCSFLLYLVVKASGRHLVKVVATGSRRGSARERENRALTLVGVFRNVASLAAITGAILMMLDEVGIPIVPLMGGAAVVGLAVAFGAQSLVKDYFSGFMLLLEDQYGINDVVRINSISGVVEEITLRVTTLRDIEGIVHFIPHGTITLVSNMTHGWSRALIDAGVAYKEDADRVMNVMLDLARELRDDTSFGPLILDNAEMLGVDALGESAVTIKMVIKTVPTKQWAVRREYLRRMKRRFDQLGIEIPFPQRTIRMIHEDATARPSETPDEP